jgi:hypothetical protein
VVFYCPIVEEGIRFSLVVSDMRLKASEIDRTMLEYIPDFSAENWNFINNLNKLLEPTISAIQVFYPILSYFILFYLILSYFIYTDW